MIAHQATLVRGTRTAWRSTARALPPVLLVAVVVLGGGCGLLAGIGDFTDAAPTGTGGTGGAGGADATGTAGGGGASACGDGTRSPGEACDGEDLGGLTCAEAGAFYAGELGCTGACALDTSGCFGAPSVPALRKPMNNAYRPRFSANARLPTFEWEPSTLAGPPAQITYHLQYGTSPEFQPATTQQVTSVKYVVTDPLVVFDTQPVGAHYYWRVRACVGAACSEYSRTWHLHVGRSPGDLDGDGYDDLLVSAIRADGAAGAAVGVIHFFKGQAGFDSTTPGAATEGTMPDGAYGSVVTAAGDVDGDGFGDVLINAPGIGMHVYFGGEDGPFVKPPHPIGVPHHGMESVASAGDVNGDGFADIIAGKPGPGAAAYIYLGGKTLGDQPDATLTPSPFADYFGKTAKGVGDINGDGFADVVVGGYVNNEAAGRIWVYFGSETGIPVPAGESDGSELFGSAFSSEARFGWAIAGCDVNGDGFSDVVVSAPSHSGGGGAAIRYLGATGSTFDPTKGGKLNKPNSGTYGMGQAMVCADLTGDGLADVVLGAPYTVNGLSGQGSFLVYLGKATPTAAPDAELLGTVQGGWMGIDVAIPGDLNGDGLADLAVTSPGYGYHDPLSTNVGKATVSFGKAVLPLPVGATFSGVAGDGFGHQVGP